MELENKKIESVNENENEENKNVHEFQKYLLQQKPAITKVKTQRDMKAWKWFFVYNNTKNRELCDIPEDEKKLLLCKFFKIVKTLDDT